MYLKHPLEYVQGGRGGIEPLVYGNTGQNFSCISYTITLLLLIPEKDKAQLLILLAADNR